MLIFLRSFLGGALVGFVAGRAVMALMAWLRNSRLAETTLTLALPYLVYTLCERYFEVSGVTAVVMAGLVINVQAPPASGAREPGLPARRLAAALVLGRLAGVRAGLDAGAAADDRHRPATTCC